MEIAQPVTRHLWESRLIAATFERLSAPSRANAKALVRELAAFPSQTHVLDVGIGPGIQAKALERELGFRITGVDPSPAMIRRSYNNLRKANLVVGTATNLPVPSNFYPVYMANYVLKFVPLAHMDKLVTEVDRVSTRSSRVIFSELRLPRKLLGAWTDREVLTGMLYQRGFKLARTTRLFGSVMMVFER